jgi:hypothetical protein
MPSAINREPDQDANGIGVLDEADVTKSAIQEAVSLFYENLGQINDNEVKFYGRIPGGWIGFAESRTLLWMDGATESVTIHFESAEAMAPIGSGIASHRTNYFLGDRGTFTDVSGFSGVHYEGLWPGIDLVYEATAEGAKYEFRIAPGANPSDIQLKSEGHDSLLVKADSVTIKKADGMFVDEGLKINQDDIEIDGQLISIEDDLFGFEVDAYDRSKTLIIDPLIYSTYVGWSLDDSGRSIAVDSSGNAYVTGFTASSNFPTLNAYDDTFNGGYDTFIFKLNAIGNDLLYSTFVGGSQVDEGFSIAVDESGNAFVTGRTTSNDFPIYTVGNSSIGGPGVFVVKLNAAGNGLLYSTIIGASNDDFGRSIAIDASGNAYVTGETWSSSFPTVNAYDNSLNGSCDTFVFKLNATGNGLVYSTYVGGNEYDYGRSIAIDLSGNAYVSGFTWSSDFPVVSAYDSWLDGLTDSFVFKLNATGSGLLYSTFVGGTSEDDGRSIAVDPSGNAYVTGETNSFDFPTQNAFDSSLNGSSDVFVFKLNATGNELLYSTFVGGEAIESGSSITVDIAGIAYVTGGTMSSDFPLMNAHDDSLAGLSDAYVFKLNATGNGLLYSTFVGGSDGDSGASIAIDTAGNAYVTGSTTSTDFPLLNAYDNTYDGGMSGDAIVFCLDTITTLTTTTTPTDTTTTTTATFLPDPTMMLFLGAAGVVVIAAVALSRRRSGVSEGPPPSPLDVIPPSEPPDEPMEVTPTTDAALAVPLVATISPDKPPAKTVEVLRGGEIVGGKFEYKVKVNNLTDYVVTNVTVTIIAYPQDCMELTERPMKTLTRIEPGGFRSPQFTFTPTKDCVEGYVVATVSFLDHENNTQMMKVEPYLIRSVCDLLRPLESTLEDFELMLADMAVTSEDRVFDGKPGILFNKTISMLEEKNFHIMETTSGTDTGKFRGVIRALAEGKYTKKRVAVRLVISGDIEGSQARVKIEGLGDDEAMLPTTLDEIVKGIES